MHRIDTDGNVSNRFDPGDPTVPRFPTVVDHHILNAFQEELINAILTASVTPTKGTNNQLAGIMANLTTAQTFTALKTFAAGLAATAVSISGTATFGGSVSVGGDATLTGHKLTSLANGSAATDAVNKAQMDSGDAVAAGKLTQVIAAYNFNAVTGTGGAGILYGPGPTFSGGPTTNQLPWIAPAPGALSLLRYTGSAAITDTGTPRTFRLVVSINGVDSALVTTMTTGDTVATDSSHTVSVVAGDAVLFRITQALLGASNNGPSSYQCVFKES